MVAPTPETMACVIANGERGAELGRSTIDKARSEPCPRPGVLKANRNNENGVIIVSSPKAGIPRQTRHDGSISPEKQRKRQAFPAACAEGWERRFSSMNSALFRIAAAFCFLAVALGAFGAHALKGTLAANDTMEVWKTAVLYHFVHALALLVLATLPVLTRAASGLFVAGIVIFSGSLYLLALTNIKWLGAITPLGGLCFLAGWVCLLIWPPL